ncbi:sigma-70 family RNA polymerase sigma factor [Kitasatospora sp. NPDC096147]|uniref:sigma-70 family RNA polymerase sigma factor n=1 Tax=Kitasatospora sp. NPDC096147 TaxID=3364093 RepID=UPI00381745AF
MDLIRCFEEEREHLRAVAYRMLGSLSEADDALQEAWLRAAGADVSAVENLAAWLTTVVGRVCLNLLRTRRTRREDPWEAGPQGPDQALERGSGADPEEEALLADSVGLALLVVLDALTPAERLAFVLHDMFAVPFDEIAPLLEKTPAAVRQLASRARRRVRGASPAPDPDLSRRRTVLDAFLAATRGGDFEALLALLHPDVALRADRRVIPTPEPVTVSGAVPVARGAMAAMARARATEVALVNDALALVMAPFGRLAVVLRFAFAADGSIDDIEVIADPEVLSGLEIRLAD